MRSCGALLAPSLLRSCSLFVPAPPRSFPGFSQALAHSSSLLSFWPILPPPSYPFLSTLPLMLPFLLASFECLPSAPLPYLCISTSSLPPHCLPSVCTSGARSAQRDALVGLRLLFREWQMQPNLNKQTLAWAAACALRMPPSPDMALG